MGDDDDGDFSAGNLTLREAVNHAAAGETISFHASLAGQTIDVHSQLAIVGKDLTIDGGMTLR